MGVDDVGDGGEVIAATWSAQQGGATYNPKIVASVAVADAVKVNDNVKIFQRFTVLAL